MNTPPRRHPLPFGKYLLLDRINIGGMAEVWRAKTFGATGIDRIVAVKRILPSIAEDEDFITMFIDEAKITVQLNHPNISQIYELANLANTYFISMEYVSGKDFRAVFDRCRKRGDPPPLALTCAVVAQCCDGLDFAHRARDQYGQEMNIVHRDVSPQNAIISYDGDVKLIDFGVAKAAGTAGRTQAGILKGKFGYMSPEQVRGQSLDRRSDIFSVGVCLYELLTGERAFVGESDFMVLEKVRKVDLPPPSHYNKLIPEQLERIVMRALACEPRDRYQHAAELAEDLRAFTYSSGQPFSKRDLAAFMKMAFADDLEKERRRNQEYSEIKAPEGMPRWDIGASGPSIHIEEVVSIELDSGALPAIVVGVPESGQLPPLVRVLPPNGNGGHHPSGRLPVPSLADVAQANNLEHDFESYGDEPVTNPGNLTLEDIELLAPQAQKSRPAELTTDPEKPAVERTVHVAPLPAAVPPPAPSPAPESRPSHSGLILTLAGSVLLLLVGLTALYLLRPKPTGLIFIEVPADAQKNTKLEIQGAPVHDDTGGPIVEWPQVRVVPVGKVTVVVRAQGYAPVIETLEVREDAEPVQLTKPFVKEVPIPGPPTLAP